MTTQSTGHLDVDVAVIGFGAAGISAAITAHDAGARVVVLEKMPPATAGGNTRVSGQVWFNPDDSDSAEDYLREMSRDMPVDAGVSRAWARETAQNTAWVAARAAEVDGRVERDPLDPYGQGSDITKISYGEETLRQTGWETHEHEFPEFDNSCGTDYFYLGPSQGFSRLWLTLKAALERRGIAVRYETRATALLCDEEGRVEGVLTETPDGPLEVRAGLGVVLAAGGFENDQAMIRTYLGLPFATPWGTPANTGDGIRIAQQLGADLANMFNHMPFMGIRIPGRETGEFVQPAGTGFINVRADGRRFIDETVAYRHGKSMIGGALEFYPHHAMWTVFDEDVRLAGPLAIPTESYAAGWLKQVDRYGWSADNAAEIEQGWIARGETVAELAAELGVDPAGLEAEIERWNAACEAGEDAVFGRAAQTLTPIVRGPFYGYRWGNLLITTLGGLRKDGEARVLDVEGRPIPGLFCAGEIASTYTWALSGGQSIGDALAFGRIAGAGAAGVPLS